MEKKLAKVKPRMPVPYRNVDALSEYLKKPNKIIAADIASGLAGAFSGGSSGMILAGGRIVQGALTSNMATQVGKEIQNFVKAGKLKKDYAETKYGFRSLAELLNFIDSEVPDEDRFQAVKIMFFVLNSADAEESEEMLNYQLFRLSMKLSASQLLLLKISHDWYRENYSLPTTHERWVSLVSEKIGHNIRTLIMQDEEMLISYGLLVDRHLPDRSGISPRDARLSDLGVKFCSYLSDYEKSVESK